MFKENVQSNIELVRSSKKEKEVQMEQLLRTIELKRKEVKNKQNVLKEHKKILDQAERTYKQVLDNFKILDKSHNLVQTLDNYQTNLHTNSVEYGPRNRHFPPFRN